MLIIVVMKLIVLRMEEIFVKWREKMVRLMDVFVWVKLFVRGG